MKSWKNDKAKPFFVQRMVLELCVLLVCFSSQYFSKVIFKNSDNVSFIIKQVEKLFMEVLVQLVEIIKFMLFVKSIHIFKLTVWNSYIIFIIIILTFSVAEMIN